MKKFILLLFCSIFIISIYSCDDNQNNSDLPQNPDPKDSVKHIKNAFEINERLGKGINMGNMFEDGYDNETGNPWNPLRPGYFKIISELGFDHVRVPVRWETRSSNSYPYTISPTFLQRIKSVVDDALSNHLHVVINMHHHEQLMSDPNGQKQRFLAQWDQLGDFFKDYPDSLVFEILNEPTISPAIWNQLLSEGLQVIRKENPNRAVLIGTAQAGTIQGLQQLILPEDDGNIILTIHYYNPFEFTHQGANWTGMDMNQWLGTTWNDTPLERDIIHDDFEAVRDFSERHDIPVHIGEFGAIDKGDIDSRARWTNYLARYFEEQEFSWAYWEFSAGFGIYDRDNNVPIQPLVNALLHNPVPEPGTVNLTPVYNSNFDNGNDGWVLQRAGGVGTLSNSNGKLLVNIQNGGSNIWSLQLIKTGITLEKNKKYLMSLTMSSSAERSYSSYIGMNADPWTAYSGTKSFHLGTKEKVIHHLFEMKKENTANARFVIDLGDGLPANLTISSISVDKVELIPN